MFNKILIAHDLSSEANHALRRAAQLARRDTAVAPEVPRHRLIADAGQPIC